MIVNDKLVIKFSISSNFFSTDFVKFFIVSISFKNMFWREIKLWVLSLYTEGSRGVCWVSGIITISWLATKLSETEDVQLIWVFLQNWSCHHCHPALHCHCYPALHFALSYSRYQQVQFGF